MLTVKLGFLGGLGNVCDPIYPENGTTPVRPFPLV